MCDIAPLNNMHQDKKSAQLIAMCKRTLEAHLHNTILPYDSVSFWHMQLCVRNIILIRDSLVRQNVNINEYCSINHSNMKGEKTRGGGGGKKKRRKKKKKKHMVWVSRHGNLVKQVIELD